jgi:hypothetical protein
MAVSTTAYDFDRFEALPNLGYEVGENDAFHWDVFLGTVFCALTAAILIWIAVAESGAVYVSFGVQDAEASETLRPRFESSGNVTSLNWLWFGWTAFGQPWLLLSAAALLTLAALTVYLSNWFRRYDYLIWWKKLIIIQTAIFEKLVLLASIIGIFMVMAFLARLPGYLAEDYSSGGGGGGGPGPGAVDRDGRPYEWSSWKGKWVKKPVGLLGDDHVPVRTGAFGPVQKTGTFGSKAYGEDGRELYEPRD